MITIASCLVTLTISGLPVLNLGRILESPGQTLKLFSQYKAEEHLNFGASENRIRFLLFKKNAQLVSTLNSAPEETAKFGLNFFSSLSSGEKHKWLGLNTTGLPPTPESNIPSQVSSKLYTPKSVDWVKEGAVTTVKSQDSCASCWAFSAVGAMESRYKIKSGRLRAFSEQEYVDCTYSQHRQERYRKEDGCNSGLSSSAYDYSTDHGGRLAAEKDYPYEGKMGKCRGTKTPNAAVAFKIVGRKMLPVGESSSIAALAEGPIWIYIMVTNPFHSYMSGVFKDTTCIGSQINHAVTGVGYTETYVLIKNSWGKWWGDKGFMKVARNRDSCGIWTRNGYPILEATGKKDTGRNDEKSKYGDEADDGNSKEDDEDNENDEDDESDEDNESDEDKENAICKDKNRGCVKDMCKHTAFVSKWCRDTCGYCKIKCEDQYSDCKTFWCKYTYFAKDQCQKTCKKCEKKDDKDGNGGCNPGLTRCPDGACKHEHMC